MLVNFFVKEIYLSEYFIFYFIHLKGLKNLLFMFEKVDLVFLLKIFKFKYFLKFFLLLNLRVKITLFWNQWNGYKHFDQLNFFAVIN